MLASVPWTLGDGGMPSYLGLGKATDAQAAQREAAAKAASQFAYSSAGTVALLAPPWSLVVAAGGVATGATIDLVRNIFHGKRSRKQAVALAQAAGFPDASEVPSFTSRALKMDPAKLTKTAEKLLKKIGKHPNRKGKNETRLQLLYAVAQIKNAAATGAEPGPSPTVAAAAAQEMDPSMLARDPVLQSVGEDTAPPASGPNPALMAVLAVAGIAVLGGGIALVVRSRTPVRANSRRRSRRSRRR